MYGPSAPLMMYSSDAAEARGATLRPVNWSLPPDWDIADHAATAAWVRAEVEPVLDEVGGAPVLIGKSLGTYGSVLAAERGLPAVWLTPLLRNDPVVSALRKATAPFLLIGGTADRGAWDGAVARDLSPHVFEADGADHGMYVPGPLAASAAVLGLVATAVERFLDEVVWPA
jgi:hypothetical protein